MTVTIQRTSKRLKLLRAIGYVCFFFGGSAFLLDSSNIGLYSAIGGATLLGVSRLLIWWFHG